MLGQTVRRIAKRIDQRYGIRPWLRGEPRPPSGGFDLGGEKILDWGWICVNLPNGNKRGLEIGCGQSPVIAAMIAKGYDVTAVDFDATIAEQIGGINFIRGDFNTVDLPGSFDIVVACSSIEHFGLSGRYGSSEDPSADITAMRKIRKLLTPAGLAFITIPVGTDVVHRPWHRVYGKQRLPLLLQGFTIQAARFLVKQPDGPWFVSDMSKALEFPVDPRRYALGELALSVSRV
jgi:SAM-dependent methyltransferase